MPNTNVLSRFGDAVKKLRNRLGISQEELAGRAGLHRTYVSDIERGARNISLESIEKLASALEISLSVLFEQSQQIREEFSSPAAGRGSLVGILLIEDDPRDVEMTQEAFKRAKILNPLHVVRDGAAALELLLPSVPSPEARKPPLPGVILLDLNLPKVSGVEILRRLKQHDSTRRIPVVVLTASQRDRDFIECQNLGADTYLIKPVGFQNFSQVTPKLSLQWALHGPV